MPVSSKKSQVKSSKTSKKNDDVVVDVKVKKETSVVQEAGSKKLKKDKKEKKVVKEKLTKPKKKVEEKLEDSDLKAGVRSFKVQLPGAEVFVGRFTGLTPYQAANKALSKYFRETKKPKNEITFSIRESTRGSKRSTYTYNGARHKLETPVEYTISNAKGEDRTIVKKFKNKLTKVKKGDLLKLA